MSMIKTYNRRRDICKVTLELQLEQDSDECQGVFVVGDFNDWNPEANPMKKSRKGFSATLELPAGNDYQFRYYIQHNDNNAQWANEIEADGSTPSPYCDAQNSVICA